jgi:ParB-like chromosome segregation protein Spo0J
MVPTSEVDKYKEYDRRAVQHPGRDTDTINKLKEDISKNGITEPLILKYGVEDGKAHLWEGNHRLAAAKELGLKEVPVRVVTSPKTEGSFGVKVSGSGIKFTTK